MKKSSLKKVIPKERITILGAGSFGTAIANMLALQGLDVLLWARDSKVVNEINNKRKNSRYLPKAKLAKLSATNDLKKAFLKRDFYIFAIPCQFIRDFLKESKPILSKEAYFVNLAKGIEVNTFKAPSEIFSDVLGKKILRRFATVSGPTFAKELYEKMPTGAVVASQSKKTAKTVQCVMSSQWFRLYRLTDLRGVELGGALKNIMAIAVGIAEGLGFGHNTRAGLMTRCLNEMTELGMMLGGKPRTFSGLSGIGDLILTCTGHLSRNRQVGLRLGRGESIEEILKSMHHVAEGVPTAKSVYQLSQKLKVEMPNTEQVYRILYEKRSPKEAVEELLSRDLKPEYEEKSG